MKAYRFHALFLAVSAFLLVSAQVRATDPPAASAQEQLATLRHALREARDKGDWPDYRARALEISTLLNGSPNSLLELARADLKLGEVAKARAEVQKVLDMGQTNEVLTAAPFDALHDLGASLAANRLPVARSRAAREIQDTGLLPEDIDFDASTRRFYLTSVLEKKIVALDSTGKMTDFVRAPDGWPMLALKVDSKRRRLWATEVALDGFSIVPKADMKRSALLCYELDKGTLIFRVEGPEHSALGDMALLSDGTPVVSDGDGGGLYRLRDNKTLERIDHGEFISPQTIAVDAEGKHLFVPDYLRGIGILDLSDLRVSWISMEGRFALAGIDGLYWHNDSLLAVQNGTSPERVTQFDLDANHSKIIAQNVIEASLPTLGDPTHGVLVGSDFYYIANSGWDTLDDHGDRVAGAKATPAHVMRFAFRK